MISIRMKFTTHHFMCLHLLLGSSADSPLRPKQSQPIRWPISLQSCGCCTLMSQSSPHTGTSQAVGNQPCRRNESLLWTLFLHISFHMQVASLPTLLFFKSTICPMTRPSPLAHFCSIPLSLDKDGKCSAHWESHSLSVFIFNTFFSWPTYI